MPGTWESRGSQGPRNVLQMGWFTQEELNNIRKRLHSILANTYEENKLHGRVATARRDQSSAQRSYLDQEHKASLKKGLTWVKLKKSVGCSHLPSKK